jgi:hypothetical protein
MADNGPKDRALSGYAEGVLIKAQLAIEVRSEVDKKEGMPQKWSGFGWTPSPHTGGHPQ